MNARIRRSTVSFGSLVLIFLVVNLLPSANAQWRNTYESAFYHALGAGAFSVAGLPNDNSNGSYQDRTYSMEALVRMFEHNGDAQLLDVLADNINFLVSRRDDRRSVPLQNHEGIITPSWTTTSMSDGARYTFLLHDAMIIYPMAEFVRIVNQSTPAIRQRIVQSASGHLYGGWTLGAIAMDLEQRIYETCSFHEANWMHFSDGSPVPMGRYRYDCNYPCMSCANPCKYPNPTCDNIHPDRFLPANMQAFMGRVHLSMWQATSTSNPTRKAYYMDRARRIGNMIRFNITENSPPSSNHYEWPYWLLDADHRWPRACNQGPEMDYWDNIEDRGHSYYVATFGHELHKSGLTYLANNSTLVFDATDMLRLSQTLVNMYAKPLQFYGLVDRSGDMTYSNYDSVGDYPIALEEMAQWIPLVEYDRDLYQMLSEIYTRKATHQFSAGATYLLGLAYCAKYEAKLNPVFIGRNGPASEWRGCAISDLDGNGVPEVAMVRNFDGDIFINRWNRSVRMGEMQHQQTLEYGTASDWVGLAAGRLNTTNKNYLVAVRRFDKKVFVFEHVSGSMQQVATYTFSGSVQPTALTVFRPMGATKDQIVVGSSNGMVYLLSYSSGSSALQLTNSYATSYSSSIVGLCGGGIGTTTSANGLLAIGYQNGYVVVTKLNSGLTQFIQASQSFSISNGVNAQWMSLAAGNFDPNLVGSELVAGSRADGKLYFLRFNPSTNELSVLGNESMVRPVMSAGTTYYLRHEVLAAGNLNVDPSRCGKDELVVIRNTDGWAFVYEVKLGFDCLITGGPKSVMTESELTNSSSTSELTVYPNPVSGELITLDLVASGTSIEFWSSSGSLMQTHAVLCDGRCEFDVSGLPDGLYLLRCMRDGRTTGIARFVVAR